NHVKTVCQLWAFRSAFFETERTSDEHLLTFIMESFPRDVCGLNFYDPQEADEFHRILVEENRGRISRGVNRPKRQAPPPPSVRLGSDRSAHRTLHIEHLGLEELSKEDQETFHHLIKAVDIEPGNEEQMQLLRNIVATRGSEVRSSMRIKRDSVHPGESFVRGNTHTTLAESRNSMMVVHKQQRRTPREVKKGSVQRQETEATTNHYQQQPTTISEVGIDQYLNPDWGAAAPSYEVQSKLHVITEAQDFAKAPYSGRQSWAGIEMEAPPVPSRIESMALPGSPVGRRKTLPYSPVHRASPPNNGAPRLPERPKPERGQQLSLNVALLDLAIPHLEALPDVATPIWRIEIPLPSGVQPPSHSPPPTPPSSQPSPVPNPTSATTSPSAPQTTAGAAAGPAVVSLAPPPPPPPPGLLSPAPTPPPCPDQKQGYTDVSPISNDRRSFLEEIQNVDKARLRHVAPSTKSLQNGDSPPGDGGLLSAIQAELDKRREYIASDSDEESDSTDSEWAD
ncbi:hypothetical protein OSTOST_15936, partial [Ostertagia ostertagi]